MLPSNTCPLKFGIKSYCQQLSIWKVWMTWNFYPKKMLLILKNTEYSITVIKSTTKKLPQNNY